MAQLKTKYTAIARRSGRWWAIEVPELPGLHSQARRLDQVPAMASEAIALLLDVAEDSIEVSVQTTLESLGGLQASIEKALAAREAAARAQDEASGAMKHAVREIRDQGYTARDAGILLGVSNQRISQLEHEMKDEAPDRP